MLHSLPFVAEITADAPVQKDTLTVKVVASITGEHCQLSSCIPVSIDEQTLNNRLSLQYAFMSLCSIRVRQECVYVDLRGVHDFDSAFKLVEACCLAIGSLLLNTVYTSKKIITNKVVFSLHKQHLVDADMESVLMSVLASLRVKQWVDSPRENLTPTSFSDEVMQFCNTPNMSVEVISSTESKKFNANYAVGRAAVDAPVVLKIFYTPSLESSLAPVFLCGKGVTFDTGGLGLKSQGGMRNMKNDMAGAAVVVSTMLLLNDLKIDVPVIGLISIAENSVGPKAMAPGDIVTLAESTTVEIVDTDAEGRLLLAELIAYAKSREHLSVISIGTLTSVVSWCIGDNMASVQTNDSSLASRLNRSGNRVGEWVWRLPLPHEMMGYMDSDWVDLVNSCGPEYGGLQPAIFLNNFAGSSTWAHLEIAGPSWNRKYGGVGGSGFGVSLITELVRSYSFDSCSES
jgi:leucyl aminopeptidase